MRIPTHLHLWCLQLSRDFCCGIPVREREELITDCVHVACALSDTVSGRVWH